MQQGVKKKYATVGSLTVLLLAGLIVAPAGFSQLPEIGKDPKRDVEVERLVGTLNDTLKENQALRENMDAMQKALERATVENNVLKTQIKGLEKNTEDFKLMEKQFAEQTEQQQQTIQALEDAKLKLADQEKNLNQAIQALSSQNEQLQTVLQEAILEEEKDAYKQLIVNSQKVSEKAVQELAANEVALMTMKADLAASTFLVANAMFQEKNYDGAKREYEKVLDLDPTFAWAHHNLGIIYDYHLSHKPMALYHYRKYLGLKDHEEEAHKIRERVLDIELLQNLVPTDPLRIDFNQYNRDR